METNYVIMTIGGFPQRIIAGKETARCGGKGDINEYF